MLLKPCGRCRKLVRYPNKYCDTCEPAAEAERQERVRQYNARYNLKRDPKYRRFYSCQAWKRMSKARLRAAHYRCEDCGAMAVEVHHVDPIQTESGWERRLDWDNLKAVCLDCHNKAHGRFQSRRSSGREGSNSR